MNVDTVAGMNVCPYGVYDNLQAPECPWRVYVQMENVPVHVLADPIGWSEVSIYSSFLRAPPPLLPH